MLFPSMVVTGRYFPTAMDIAFMSSQCITPTIGLVADQTPGHFVSTNNVSIPSYAFQLSYNHWIIVTTTTSTATTTTATTTTTTTTTTSPPPQPPPPPPPPHHYHHRNHHHHHQHHHNHHYHQHHTTTAITTTTTTISTSCYGKLRFSLRLYLILDFGLEVIRS